MEPLMVLNMPSLTISLFTYLTNWLYDAPLYNFIHLILTIISRPCCINPLDAKLFFCQTPVGARLMFSMLLLGAELIFANLSPDAGLFFEPEKRHDPSRALMPVTK